MLEIKCTTHFSKRKTTDALVLPFWNEEGKAKEAFKLSSKFEIDYSLPIKYKDFTAEEGSCVSLYFDKGTEKRIVLLGLGEKSKFSLENVRLIFAEMAQYARKNAWHTLNVVVPECESGDFSQEEFLQALCEGIALPNYYFDLYKDKTVKKNKKTLLSTVYLIGIKQWNREAKDTQIIVDAVHFTRDLINGNADDVTPLYLASEAKRVFRSNSSVKVTIFDKKSITSMGMGLLLAVNRGSKIEPRLIVVEYEGNPKSNERTVLIGKGVTYDTGGLNLKPTGFMEEMKCDMSGAAAVLGTLKAIAELELPVNVIAVIPATENGIDAESFKPGDCYKSYSGKTVEIGNTDAEGRLILADALAYAVKKLKPTHIIDFATLTGAVVVALGEDVTGLMSNNDALAEELIEAGKKTYERVWRLPLVEEYKKQLNSKIADLKNIGEKREAGTITAALFLQEFVEGIPWAHLDIAGTAYPRNGNKVYHNSAASGVGVRLMVQFFKNKK
jgi:leucyl aminopeptidase